MTKRVPKTKKGDRTPFADFLLRHPDVRKALVAERFFEPTVLGSLRGACYQQDLLMQGIAC